MTTDTTIPKPFVFVLMPFAANFSDIYKFGIKGAADDVGAYAERIDEQLFTEGILDRIFNQISKADVIVADMTGRNPNVFYEVGYAHALGKSVILLTQKEEDIPFDLKHKQHVIYDGDIDKLRTELAPRIKWAIGEKRQRILAVASEQISIQLLGVPITAGVDADQAASVGGDVKMEQFTLPLIVRNDGVNPIYNISHLYLFAPEKPPVFPCSKIISEGDSSFRNLKAMKASEVDAYDSLSQQFRLKNNRFSSIPPGAIEENTLQLQFAEGVTKCDTVYRLRLHTTKQFHDFTFRLKVQIVKREAKTQVKDSSSSKSKSPPKK